MAGGIVMAGVRERGIQLFPVDSEHSAIFQALEGNSKKDVAKIILTASGGPFRGRKKEELATVTLDQALQHPNWSMGAKISIDSATLMNKGLEVIEAFWLFSLPPDKIEVLVHPQSIVHSLVEYQDGSVMAQLGIADMRMPIAYALSYPERLPLKLPQLDLIRHGNLQFEAPDVTAFPALALAYQALESGGVLPAVLNAANEVAVEAFLQRKIAFLQIPEIVERTMERVNSGDGNSLEDILAADGLAREHATACIPA
ncbi:unnamed protein product [Cyprideis torosa]|uniref:1-deoxy-D-xylulose-5-phosphate reductoisomerase n=1 Tax=Cyprideis torosa TaxID=163714 RepID=A0A7R8WT76_9CRUS|nr:unnamed protein product [Cyprideis torosa]CAG0909816.1 unnamed protein product [Cyprideis torosa]